MTLEEFQNAALERRQAKGRRPEPYDSEQRTFATEYAKKEFAAGVRKSVVLRALGISDGTLSKWLGKDFTKEKGFRRVTVRPGSLSDGGLQIVTPGGYRIEGLSVASAAALLRALG